MGFHRPGNWVAGRLGKVYRRIKVLIRNRQKKYDFQPTVNFFPEKGIPFTKVAGHSGHLSGLVRVRLTHCISSTFFTFCPLF